MRTPMRRLGDAGGGGNDLLLPSDACFVDNCEAIEPWSVHYVCHRNNAFHHLCTSCILKLHPGHLCCACFKVLDSFDRPPLIHCSKCPSVAHLSCLPDPTLSPLFLCLPCDFPSPTSFSYFPYSKNSTNRVIDLQAAKVLLTSARLSVVSMSRAGAIARIDAEKKVKEAGLARTRAREKLDGVFDILAEKEKKTMALFSSIADAANMEGGEPKKKAPKPSTAPSSTFIAVAAQKRAQEREKCKRFSKPIGLLNRSTLETGRNEKIKGPLNS